MITRSKTDILIIGTGGAGLFAALHAHKANPGLDITITVKGLLGKCGCTRMVQGGYNVALGAADSLEQHFMDTILGGKWLPQQDIAWRLVEGAVERIHELENELGCFFDRNPDGTLHQKALAGQTFDRTVHKGDLTGIEIMNRLSEQVMSLPIRQLDEHRAVSIIPDKEGGQVAGALFIDIRQGSFHFVEAKSVLLATGAGPTMYRYHTPSGEKTCDGLAMALRMGLSLRDMEMVQFHPTGLLAGAETRMTGTVLEEGLRGAGGYLLGGDGERFMHRYDDRLERATRDIVSRSIFEEMRADNTSANGGVFLEMQHLGPEIVRDKFAGMVKRCADCGFDLAAGRVEVVPTAHYMMGGIEFEIDCRTSMPGLYVAGEDGGGVHGANRLGGNGVANSTVFGGIAGDSMAAFITNEASHHEPDEEIISNAVQSCLRPFSHERGDLNHIRDRLNDIMWNDVGIIRDESGLLRASMQLKNLSEELYECGIPVAERLYNLTWHDWLNLQNQLFVSRTIAAAAIQREDSRGAHFRGDFPETGPLESSRYTQVSLVDGNMQTRTAPVSFDIVSPGYSLPDQSEERSRG